MKNEIIEHRNSVVENIYKSFSEDLEKAFPIGTIRNWGGDDYKKVGDNEWIKVLSGKKVAASTMIKHFKEDVKDLRDKKDYRILDEKRKKSKEIGKPTESMQFRVLWDSKFSKEIEYVNSIKKIDEDINDVLSEISELSSVLNKTIKKQKKEITTTDERFVSLGLLSLSRFGLLDYKDKNGKNIRRGLSAKEALGTVDSSNYFLYTFANFDEILQDHWDKDENNVHRKFVDAVAEFNRMKDTGKYEYTHSPKSDSEYLVDNKAGVVYRLSNHWGKAASCNWYIRYKGKQQGYEASGRYILAKCSFKDFLRKETTSNVFENPEYVNAGIIEVKNCLNRIKNIIDSGVVFSSGAKKEIEKNWNICKNRMSNVGEDLRGEVEKIQKEYERLFEI